ncbi:MAG TPA: cytochrome d ubiquinol oxidase subunit II [Frankiaceae bacterium]|jgi:cytochrome d ubiquinol oxidase subunit II|nr:cytochrome d ubiquinol oxidase subunit II [Frankiaceae bacterium]
MLATIPLLFILAGLALYTVLGGADFGAGLWQLSAGRGPRARAIRDHAHHSMAPVWEANHVWLIFALTVGWTAYPVVIGAVASTSTIPLSIAGLGIIARGIAYALQSATDVPHERRVIDAVFGLSSMLTPYMLGSALGAIASGRVPVGNAAGNLVTSWLNPTSILCGALAVAVGAFLAAVYLAADARRLGLGELQRAFRSRALAAGVLAGLLAVAGLIVVHHDAERIYRGLTSGWGLAAVIVSALAGLMTLALVWGNRFQLARGGAALAVAAILAGWAAAQRPIVLPGLTLHQAAAPNDTLVALIIAVLVGGLILAPSLGLLFRLVLAGGLDPTDQPDVPVTQASARHTKSSGRLAQTAIGCLLVGVVLLTLADPGAAHVVGVIALLTAAVLGFAAVAPDQTALDDAPKR